MLNSTKGHNFRQVQIGSFGDNKINVTEEQRIVLERVENFVGKGENAGFQHFLLFPQCFQKAYS